MSDQTHVRTGHDLAPGEEEQHSVGTRILGYVVGLVLALLLTATSFFIAGTDLVWQPSIPVALIVLQPDQLGILLAVFSGAFVAIGAGHLLPEAQHRRTAGLSPLVALAVLGAVVVVATRSLIG